MRLSVRVRPGARRTAVGGRYGDSEVLCVAVAARAVDGGATEAVLRAVASAFALPRGDVRLVSGRTARSKVLEIAGADEALRPRLLALLGDR